MVIRALSSMDDDWPAGLNELADCPSQLFVTGQLPALDKAVAIVGTRRTDALAERFTRALAAELARDGCTIVSGGARGIDTAAHEGALEVGGATVAVLPSSLQRPYPTRNAALFRAILERGALVSEHGQEVPPLAHVFLARNRLIAALARLVIVAQAPVRSGAMSTAAHARELGRPIMAVPYAPWEVRGEGCLTLLADGAHVCRSFRDVLSLAAPSRAEEPGGRRRKPRKRDKNQELDGDERGVHEALAGAPQSADELCDRTGMAAPRVQRALLMLLLSGVIQDVGCGRYARVARY
jgi:DNA processing protein